MDRPQSPDIVAHPLPREEGKEDLSKPKGASEDHPYPRLTKIPAATKQATKPSAPNIWHLTPVPQGSIVGLVPNPGP